jgi:hypothetical protein
VVADKRNTLYYPSNGDDHPSRKGNRKATDEIVPLLNVYYHRWLAGQGAAGRTAAKPAASAAQTATTGTRPTPPPVPTPPPAAAGDLIDNFEQSTSEWVVFSDEGNPATRLSCVREVSADFRGKAGLGITYTVAPESWASCSLVYPMPQDWRMKTGISLLLRAKRPAQELHIVVYQGDSADSLSHFEYSVVTTAKTAAGWQRLDIPWKDFKQPPWEGDGTTPFDPGRAMGLAFAFNGEAGGASAGKIWVDDIYFLAK